MRSKIRTQGIGLNRAVFILYKRRTKKMTTQTDQHETQTNSTELLRIKTELLRIKTGYNQHASQCVKSGKVIAESKE